MTAQEDRELVLSVNGVRTEFSTPSGYRAAVRGVSFDVRRFDRIGIVGESGSGKSALALSVMGLINPPGRITAGEVHLNGRNIAHYSDRRMRKIRGNELALIYQDPMMALDPIRTIGHQLMEAILLHQRVSHRVARRLALDLLRDVEVPSAERRLDDYPYQYSGGMRQRVVIAMALANNPDVLIADEPTTALDVTTQAQVLKLLRRLADERGAGMVLITHDLGVVAEFCTDVLVMYAGRIVEKSTVDTIFSSQLHPYTRALLGSMPRAGRKLGERFSTIGGVPPSLEQIGGGCAFYERCPLAHGRLDCRTISPKPVTVPGLGGRVVSECHHFDELAGRKVE